MSINGVGARQVALRSSVALHAGMAVSGLIMLIFLLAHICGYPKIFQGRQGLADLRRICVGLAAERIRIIAEREGVNLRMISSVK